MKAVVFQGEGVSGVPSRQELVEHWQKELAGVPQLDEVKYFDRQSAVNADAAFGDADIVMGTFPPANFFTEAFLDRHPNLKYVSCGSHGFGRIDFELFRKRNIFFTNTIYSQQNIAEFAFALLLDICHDVALHSDYYKGAHWDDLKKNGNVKTTSFTLTRQIELCGKTFGIIGLGHIGLCAARIAHGFGMKVIATVHRPKSLPDDPYIEQVSFEELLARSDVLSIHCPLTDQTRGIFDAAAFARMKDGAILINTARGEIVDEDALADALISGKLYAAGLDVVSGEPLKAPNRLMSCPRVKITPHIAWAPPESRFRGISVEAGNLKKWLNGEPIKNLAEE